MNFQGENAKNILEILQEQVEYQTKFQERFKLYNQRARRKHQFLTDLFTKLQNYNQEQSNEKQKQQINQPAIQEEQNQLKDNQQNLDDEIQKIDLQIQQNISSEQEQIKNDNNIIIIPQTLNQNTNNFDQSLSQDIYKGKLRQRKNTNKKQIKHGIKQKKKYQKKLKRPEQCQICSAKFVNYLGLVKHEQKSHNIIREVEDQELVKEES